MRPGQVISCLFVTAALAATVLLVANLGHGSGPGRVAGVPAGPRVAATPSRAGSLPVFAERVERSTSSAASRSALTHPTRALAASSSPKSVAAGPAVAAAGPSSVTSLPASSAASTVRPATHWTPAAPRPHRSSAPLVRGGSLPLPFSTGSAAEVITVVASSTGSTTATLQAWQRAPGGGWLRHGPSVLAHVGADGLSSSPSESRSATPIGSFTLTQAFGRDSDPGTGLPYLRTTPADWWISQSGPLYNTRQRCSSGCGFNQGSPNEHLYYETPYYDYAVVIDYNTRNAPGGVRQGAGSAFFLHVTDGAPTAGCVAIPRDQLVSIMRWLSPSSHPRILIGTS